MPTSMPNRRLVLTLALIGALALPRPAAAEDVPVIAAASDLQFALTEIAAAFQADTGQTVSLTLGSTGTIATQIRQGAPFQMFLAADEAFIADLYAEGLTRDEGVLYAEGRLVIMVPHGAALQADAALTGLTAMLDAGTLGSFAIANPDHAPYGKRAEEALRHAGLWDQIQPHLVLGENVSQAAQFALSGNADGGLVAWSLALAPQVSVLGDFALIPQDWHKPLLQRMVLLPNAGTVAEAFYAYMQSPKARVIMVKYGFVLPEGT